MKKLVGSTTSPFVRRIRVALFKENYDFECVNVFSPEGQQTIAKYTTTGRIPILVDGENIIWDSLLIAQYLSNNSLSIEEQKQLVLINEMTDAGIQLFQLRKFETDVNDQSLFSKNNLARIQKILDHFEKRTTDKWEVITQWLYCTLDWFDFRSVYDWRLNHPNLVEIHQKYAKYPEIIQTDPRQQ